MVEEDFGQLAGFVADVVVRNKNVGDEVTAYRRKFLEMKFCLSPEDSAELGAAVLESVFPKSTYAARFAENMLKVAGGII
jgi:hypothetical protein